VAGVSCAAHCVALIEAALYSNTAMYPRNRSLDASKAVAEKKKCKRVMEFLCSMSGCRHLETDIVKEYIELSV
jgi:hypothetical protein